MFWFLKFIMEFFAPLTFFFGLLIFSAILSVFGKKILSKLIFGFSIISLLFFSYEIGQNMLARPLEKDIPICEPTNYPNIKTIVILGGGRNPESNRTVSALLSRTTLTRLVEGISVFNLTDANNLIVTGADLMGGRSIAALMKECAINLGVDESKIITIDNARNTREEAKYTADFVRGDSIFLVTSASHLKRAKKNFEREGIFVVPVATDYIVQNGPKTIWAFFPNSDRITNSGRAIREYLGLFYEIFRK